MRERVGQWVEMMEVEEAVVEVGSWEEEVTKVVVG